MYVLCLRSVFRQPAARFSPLAVSRENGGRPFPGKMIPGKEKLDFSPCVSYNRRWRANVIYHRVFHAKIFDHPSLREGPKAIRTAGSNAEAATFVALLIERLLKFYKLVTQNQCARRTSYL